MENQELFDKFRESGEPNFMKFLDKLEKEKEESDES